MKSSSNNAGFSLIEVMVAVVILASVSILAMNSMSTAINQTGYLQQKMIAVWVAENRLTQLRLSLRLGQAPSSKVQEVEQDGMVWTSKLIITKTTEDLTRVEVVVYSGKNTKNPIYNLDSFISTAALTGTS